jgi:putative ABC transport system ATP-binding protein
VAALSAVTAGATDGDAVQDKDTVEPVVRARELYRFYRAGDEETLALRGVSLEAMAGQVLVITGPSGSGKSTLLACLAGLDEPDGGSVYLRQYRISHRLEAERSALRARHIGTLFQSANLLEHLTVRRNLELAQRIAGRRDRDRASALLEAVELTRRADARPGELSGGEAVRAGIAVALANNPDALIADEPTGELDGATEATILRLIRNQADQGTAVIIASHSAAVTAQADRTIKIKDGQVQA